MKSLRSIEPSKEYHRTKLALSLVSTGVEWVYLLVLVLTPLAAWLVGLTGLNTNPYLHFLLFSLAAGFIAQLLSSPFSFASGYLVERYYGLSNQTLAAWVWESVKGLLVGGVIGLPLALIFYACLRTFGSG
ncbi:M48 family peptidase, partial [Candidatus Neomarinimicrobiota bacterium]